MLCDFYHCALIAILLMEGGQRKSLSEDAPLNWLENVGGKLSQDSPHFKRQMRIKEVLSVL